MFLRMGRVSHYLVSTSILVALSALIRCSHSKETFKLINQLLVTVADNLMSLSDGIISGKLLAVEPSDNANEFGDFILLKCRLCYL